MEKFKIEVSSKVGCEYVEVNGKGYHIPQKELQKLMSTLDLSKNEAIDLWLSDNDYVDNEVIDELTRKAKENKTDKIIVVDKTKEKKTRNVEPKQNPDKEMLIQLIAEALRIPNAISDVKITNKTKYISFRLNDKDFEVNLIEKRKKVAK